MPRASNPKPSSKLLASRPSWRNWKAGETNCGNRTGNVFLNVFNLMYAKPLDVTRILRPRIGRGGHAECPRGINVPWPHARSQTVRIREHIAISTVRDQALATDANCPQTVRSLELSTSANWSRTRILRDPRLARNCPRRGILVSTSSLARSTFISA